MRQLIDFVAWCATWCAFSPGALHDARSGAKSLCLLNNLKHCNQTKIKQIVQNCITIFKINMHELFIFWLILFIIYLIKFLNKTPLIYFINIKTTNNRSFVKIIFYFIILNLILSYMDFSRHNIERITEWIQCDYNFRNPGYTIAFKDEQVVLEQRGKELKQVWIYILLVPRYLLYFKCWHITCLSCIEQCRRHIFKFEIIVPCPICKQSSSLNEIYSYKVETKRFYSISIKMIKQAKFIFSYKGCEMSYSLEIIHHYEMFKCLYRSILCPPQGCIFISNVETVILHSINWPFHLLYWAFCKSLCNVSVMTHDFNVINSQRSILSLFKY